MHGLKARWAGGMLAWIVMVWVVSACAMADTVHLRRGHPIKGKVVAITSLKVELEGGSRDVVPVNQIKFIVFDGEPKELSQARAALEAGRTDRALQQLAKLKAEKITRPEIRQDVQFYRAMALASSALAGRGSLQEAGKRMQAFKKTNANSFHRWRASETVGDLLVALGRADRAQTHYALLGKTEWPEYQIRSHLLLGRALLRENKPEKALEAFAQALATETDDPTGLVYHQEATLGKAAALAAQGETQQAVRLAESVVREADENQPALHARAYVTLGNAYRLTGKHQEALLAFLHVELLYPNSGELHAEALANLVQLWPEVDRADRALEAKKVLHDRYPMSRWTKNE